MPIFLLIKSAGNELNVQNFPFAASSSSSVTRVNQHNHQLCPGIPNCFSTRTWFTDSTNNSSAARLKTMQRFQDAHSHSLVEWNCDHRLYVHSYPWMDGNAQIMGLGPGRVGLRVSLERVSRENIICIFICNVDDITQGKLKDIYMNILIFVHCSTVLLRINFSEMYWLMAYGNVRAPRRRHGAQIIEYHRVTLCIIQ